MADKAWNLVMRAYKKSRIKYACGALEWCKPNKITGGAARPCDFARLPLVALGSRVTARFGMRHALAACLCVLVPSSAQRFAVELDSPPDARWDDIAPLYRAPYSAAISSLTADPEKRLVVQLVEAALRASPSLAARIYPVRSPLQ
ncbi:hypothetical protein T492DRAFT_855624 [Pavlovales sp. CCMP2436]|nr:hypothetical protein T492DRAFT_855624 [Pavlovales sp. CCMP2436]